MAPFSLESYCITQYAEYLDSTVVVLHTNSLVVVSQPGKITAQS